MAQDGGQQRLPVEGLIIGILFGLMGLVGIWYGWGHWRAPELASHHGAGIDAMMGFLLVATGSMFLIGHLILGFFVWRSSFAEAVTLRMARPRTEKVVSITLGVVMALVAEGGVVAIGIPVWDEYFMAEPAAEVLTIEVTAQQFAWNVRYTGDDGVFGRLDPHLIDDVTNPLGRDPNDPAGRDDVYALSAVYVPVGEPVRIRLRSRDVIHSFFLPHLRVKQDAVPGMTIEVVFTPTREGTFPIACTELCGMAHYRMQGLFHVVSQQEFSNWLREQAD